MTNLLHHEFKKLRAIGLKEYGFEIAITERSPGKTAFKAGSSKDIGLDRSVSKLPTIAMFMIFGAVRCSRALRD